MRRGADRAADSPPAEEYRKAGAIGGQTGRADRAIFLCDHEWPGSAGTGPCSTRNREGGREGRMSAMIERSSEWVERYLVPPLGAIAGNIFLQAIRDAFI